MRDHTPLPITIFRGTFNRGEDEICPAGFFVDSLNVEFLKNGLQTRKGISPDDLSPLIPADLKIRRVELYERTGEAQKLLILDDTGKIWDSVTGAIILSIPTMLDFSCTVIYERAFISPHNGNTGLPGEKVYVYEGSGAARPAAGIGPSSSPGIIAADSALSGRCEVGIHGFGVAFESASGYISPLGAFTTFSPMGEKKIDLSSIPLGPAGTVARHIFATKVMESTSDPMSYTYYFVPNGRVPDNLATLFTIDFFDADLLDEASHLLEQLSEIPAGVGVGQFKASLIVWGENANSSIVRVSKPGEPEAHNGADGYMTVYPGIGLGIKNCVEYRSQLLMFKSHRTYAVVDNDDVAATWDPGEIDGSIGTECHGVGQILNIGSNIEDRIFVSDRSGLRLFAGSFSDDMILTYNIDDIWGRITKTAFHTVEISVDAINAKIYVSVPLDGATTPTHILYGDYSEGLGEEFIKWTIWKFPVRPTSLVCSLINGEATLKFGSLDGYVFKHDPAQRLDVGQRIQCLVKFPYFPVGELDENVYHFTGIRMRVRGVGTIQITVDGLDSVDRLQCQSLLITELPGRPLFRGFNFTSEHCSVLLELTNAGDWMTMTKFILYPSVVWEARPAV